MGMHQHQPRSTATSTAISTATRYRGYLLLHALIRGRHDPLDRRGCPLRYLLGGHHLSCLTADTITHFKNH